MEKQPVVFFNGPICTADGLYRVSNIKISAAKTLVKKYGFVSAIGHQASATILSQLLDIEVPMNRVQYVQSVGQKAIALTLNIRAAEGQILSVEEMNTIGFGLKLLERLE